MMPSRAGISALAALVLTLSMGEQGIRRPPVLGNIDEEIARYRGLQPPKGSLRPLLPKGRCVNANRMLEVSEATRDQVSSDIAKAGFKIVRIPVDLSAHASESSPFDLDPTFTKKAIDLANQLVNAGLFVILDFHRYPELSSNPDMEEARFLSIWRQASSVWSVLPKQVAFEVINEPRGKLTPDRYNVLLKKTLPIIRKSNPTRIVIVDAPWVAHYKGLSKLDLPVGDAWVVPSFHYYDPMAFTHQNASWMKKYQSPQGFGSIGDLQSFQEAVEAVNAYSKSTGKVPFGGEFGVIDNVAEPLRLKYMTLVAEGFASIGVPMCAWTWDPDPQAFTIQQGEEIYPGFEKALIPAR